MEVAYRVREGDAFEKDFTHLRYRVLQLENYLVCFYARGDLNGIVSGEYDRTGIPYFEEVAFDDEAARAYEEGMKKFFARLTRKQGPVPFPKFAVRLKVNFCDGNVEERSFDFSEINGETLSAFCSEIVEEGDRLWRERFRCGRV